MKTAVELVEALRYKLRMFGVPLSGPTNMYCDNEAVFKNASNPTSMLRKKHHSISYHRCREAVAAGTVRVAKEGTKTNLADIFTKLMAATTRNALLDFLCTNPSHQVRFSSVAGFLTVRRRGWLLSF